MVIYDMACPAGHRFEGWFVDLEACQHQAQAGQLTCPVCGDSQITRLFTGSAIRRSAEDKSGGAEPAQVPAPAPAAPAAPASATPESTAQPELTTAQVREVLGTLAAQIRAQTQDVGPRFAQEARKMHEGDAPARMIRGTATPEEQEELAADEVPFMKLPLLATDD